MKLQEAISPEQIRIPTNHINFFSASDDELTAIIKGNSSNSNLPFIDKRRHYYRLEASTVSNKTAEELDFW